MAIQLMINEEMGVKPDGEPWQGSFAVECLTDLVMEAVYRELEAISERGGVLGPVGTMCRRGKIQK